MPSTASAVHPLYLEDGVDEYPLGAHLEYLEDRGKNYNIDNIVMAVNFVASTKEPPNFGFTPSAVWGRFTVVIPDENSTKWYLEIAYPLLDSIEFYTPEDDGTYKMKRAGDTLPFSQREIENNKFVFSLKSEPGKYTYYVRIETTSSLSMPFSIVSQKGLISDVNTHQMLYGIFYGALLVMFLFNLLLAISIKDITYYYYVMYIASFMMVSLVMSGTGFQYLWRNTIWLNDMTPFAIFFCFFWILMFTRSFLHTSTVIPVFDKFLIIILVMSALGFSVSHLFPYPAAIRTSAAYAILFVPLLMAVGILSYKKGIRQARFYLIAFAFFLAGVFLTAMNRFGLLPSSIFTVWSFQFGSLLQIVLLSFALGDRINLLKEQRELARNEALKNQKIAIESLEEAHKIKDEFLNNLSHELKTPLAVLYMYAELIRDADESEIEDVKSYADKIYNNIDKLKGYIEDLVLITNVESEPSLQIRDVALYDVIERNLSRFSGLIEKNGLSVKVDADRELTVQADESSMQKAVGNVIKNAVIFNKRGGEISISAKVLGERAELIINDTGIGIPEEDIEKIWEKFYRVDTSLTYEVSGVGIGLFLARRIVEMHEGSISVESRAGKGSSFTITLPLREKV